MSYFTTCQLDDVFRPSQLKTKIFTYYLFYILQVQAARGAALLAGRALREDRVQVQGGGHRARHQPRGVARGGVLHTLQGKYLQILLIMKMKEYSMPRTRPWSRARLRRRACCRGRTWSTACWAAAASSRSPGSRSSSAWGAASTSRASTSGPWWSAPWRKVTT